MPRLKVQCDTKAEKCICLAKGIARGEGDSRLDTVHLVKAACLAFPEEAHLGAKSAGDDWVDALRGFVSPQADLQAEDKQMPITKELAEVLRRLGCGDQVVSLVSLVNAILLRPSVRVKALIRHLGPNIKMPAHQRQGMSAALARYSCRREWLADLHYEWKLRKSAARACGLSVGFYGDESSPSRPYAIDEVMDAVVRLSATIREKANASPASLDPLGALSVNLDPTARAVCEGILVNEVYGLDIHPMHSLSVRELALMLSPEVYPANCQKVLAAVESLKELGLVHSYDSDGPALSGERMRLSDQALGLVLDALAVDQISSSEATAMKRLLRHDAAWYVDEATKAI